MTRKKQSSAKKKVSGIITEFAKRVKSSLWREDNGPSFNAWTTKVEYLMTAEGGGYTKNQAVILASKDYPCLKMIFRDYDIKEFDPKPESHPDILYKSDLVSDNTLNGVVCENTEQTYKENLQWAISAAGKERRTGEKPKTCPNDTAYYLYIQAISEPKEFMSRLGQVEIKHSNSESEEDKEINRSGKRSVKEIEYMVQELMNDG